jgi:hypothetical protein
MRFVGLQDLQRIRVLRNTHMSEGIHEHSYSVT